MRRNSGKKSDARATSAIEAAGWILTRLRCEGQPYSVAKKEFREADGSRTTMYESSRTLEGLAKIVERREREEGHIRREEQA